MTTRRFISCLLAAAVAICLAGRDAGAKDAHDKAKAKTAPGKSKTHLLVKPKKAKDIDAIAAAAGATVSGSVGDTDYYRVKVGTASTAETTYTVLAANILVDDVSYDDGVDFPEGGGSTIPLFGDDPTSCVSTQTAMTRINAAAARARATGSGVVVAVIDTGIDSTHSLVSGHVSGDGWDFVDGDSNPADVGNGIDDNLDGDVDEGVGHGTFVASIILAIAPDATILPLRALNSDAFGTASGVACAIAYAVQHGAKVVNLSLGTTYNNPAIAAAVTNARSSGVVLTGAAGNDGVSSLDYPAAQGQALGATAVDNADVRAAFSQYGSTADLSAPGVSVIGAFPGAPSGTARWSGTSFSTAMVSGGAALLRQQHPTWTPQDVENRLRNTAVNVSSSNPGTIVGSRLDLDAATQ